MKIILFTFSVLELSGGHEISVAGMAKELASHKGDDVTVVSMNESFGIKLGKILNFYYLQRVTTKDIHRVSTEHVINQLGNSKYVKCESFKQLRSLIRKSDLVISKNEILESLILKYIVRPNNIKKLLYDCATAIKYDNPSSLHQRLHNLLYLGYLYRHIASNVNLFLVKNTDEQKIYSKMFKNSGVIYRPNLFDINRLKTVKESRNYKLALNHNLINVLWLGRLNEQKDVELLKNTIQFSNMQYPNKFCWHIAGEGEEKHTIDTLVHKYNNVNYYGHVPNEYVSNLYNDADVFLSTSRWESFGNTLIEAMAQGTPCISRNISGPNDIIIQNVNGDFAETVDEICLKIIEVKPYDKNMIVRSIDRFALTRDNNLHNTLLKH